LIKQKYVLTDQNFLIKMVMRWVPKRIWGEKRERTIIKIEQVDRHIEWQKGGERDF
jgi:hypothetical protein